MLDELTTYRVFLEGGSNGVFIRDVFDVKAQSLRTAQVAIDKLQALPLEEAVQEQIEEMKKAIAMTAFDNNLEVAKQALDRLHPILTSLNRAVDPDSLA